MNEEIEYAEMLEIPVSTVNVVRKQRRRRKNDSKAPSTSYIDEAPSQTAQLKDSLIEQVNNRLIDDSESTAPTSEETDLFAQAQSGEGRLDFDPIPERIDTVRLYSPDASIRDLYPQDYEMDEYENEGSMYGMNRKKASKLRIALGVEFGVACALCGAIFLTNVFMPNSAINTFFRALSTPTTEANADSRLYTDFTLTPVVSELSDTELSLSAAGILSFTDECCVYPAANGTVCEVTQNGEGFYTIKLQYSDSFTGIINGLDYVYYTVGDSVKANVPVGYSNGETEVQVTMYSSGMLLNCFELTEENCLAWVTTEE